MADDEKKPKPTGRVRSGIARAKALSPVRKTEIARKAAIARWGAKPATATHKGSFQEHFGVDVECYVLDDGEKTAVISQTGLARILGLSVRGNAFPSFINSQTMSPFVGGELAEKIDNPVKFQWGSGGGGMPANTTLHGFDSAILIDICNAIIAAETAGALKAERYRTIKQQAHLIVGASAKSGIRQLVYALAGYSPTAEEVINAFKLYVQEEARKYEQEFPNALYAEWHRLYEIDVPERGKPWHFKHLTVNHVYQPLAQSNGKILQLTRAQKASGGKRRDKLHQFLSEVGVKALRTHLGQLLGIAQFSDDRSEYERKVRKAFGANTEMDV